MRGIRACLFDVFGTVVDWHGSVTRELQAFGERRGIDGVDWATVARDWRKRYQPALEEVRSGRRPWVVLDVLHRENLLDVWSAHGFPPLTDEEADELNLAWHRLDPWPDSVAGLTRLKARYVVAPCSNGNVALVEAMAQRARLPWDRVLGAEPTRSYKPQPETYLGSCRLLGIEPHQALMVAAHNNDLLHAKAAGLRTAFVPRPTERESEAAPGIDLVVADFVDLAVQLGC